MNVERWSPVKDIPGSDNIMHRRESCKGYSPRAMPRRVNHSPHPYSESPVKDIPGRMGRISVAIVPAGINIPPSRIDTHVLNIRRAASTREVLAVSQDRGASRTGSCEGYPSA